MVLRMKNFNIFGVHWKIRLLGGLEKPIYRGECLKRGSLDSLLIQGGLGKKEWGGGVVLGGVDTPMHTMIKLNYTNIALLLQEATQKYQKFRLLNKMLLSLSLSFPLLTVTCAYFTFLSSRDFQFLDTVLHKF